MHISLALWSVRTFVEDQFRITQESNAFLLPDNDWNLREEGEYSWYIFYHPLASQVTTHCQYLDQRFIKNMKCYYRADFVRNLIHHCGMIPDFQSCCTIRVPFLMLPGPGTMFKIEE